MRQQKASTEQQLARQHCSPMQRQKQQSCHRRHGPVAPLRSPEQSASSQRNNFSWSGGQNAALRPRRPRLKPGRGRSECRLAPGIEPSSGPRATSLRRQPVVSGPTSLVSSTRCPVVVPRKLRPRSTAQALASSDLTAVGFEPTQIALVELESTPLDHSGKLSLVWRSMRLRAWPIDRHHTPLTPPQ